MFKKIVYSLEYLLGVKVLDYKEYRGICCSYFEAIVEYRNEVISIWLLRDQPWIVFTSHSSIFINHPPLTGAFHSYYPGYRILTAEELNEPLEILVNKDGLQIGKELIHHFSLYDMNYWQPKTVGDVLFNWWD
ncbi:hypothetical protein ACFO25_03500 [Paenactinomyces guangxiensis]|uniref:Uncharacterized protein n=1 Tax=Paenactinomyces guangxiensis TaxID=1490290 RepID=A0A7W1WRP2_9BACL|nr:hypothetical protein [Paenactinomyces guangxiensis]MBA4494830.1 hypothetical protein [Paenactinomyces guangxiensis]MBH8591913.1 hypothetical protein [Paenactinomyces guangxiensis]